ncbi:hypothetical protein Tco_0824527, partial [Tanacetum coccineum]
QSYEQVIEDAHVTLIASHKTDDSKQSSSVSSNFANQFLILEKVPPSDHEVASLMNIKMSHEVPRTQIPFPLIEPATVIPNSCTIASTIVPPTISMISPLPQLTTPTPAPTTASTTTSIPALPDFSSLFGFDQRVSTLETELSQLKQADLCTQVLESVKSQLPTIVDDLLSTRIRYATRTALQSYTQDFEKKAQEERKLYIDVVEKSMKDIIKDESTITESLENVVLAKSSSQPQSTYEAAASLIKFELKKILSTRISLTRMSMQAEEPVFETADTKMPQDQGGDTEDHLNVKATLMDNWFKKPERPLTPDLDWNAIKYVDSRPPQQWIIRIDQAEKPPLTFDKLMSTPIEFSAYCYKAVTDQLDWNNPEGHEYPFDLSKPLSLIDAQGRQVVHVDYFFNNDLEYLKGGKSSRKYTTSTTKTKAAKYDNIDDIEDMVPTLWIPVKHDVFSRKRIIAVTHVKVMKWYGYGYLEEIIVRREDQTLHKFKEGNFLRLNLRDIEDLLLLLVQKKLSNLEKDVIFDVNVALRMFTRHIVILKRVKDLQLGVESYQKKLNITKPETFRSDISKLTPYTAYKNPQGIIY